MSARKPSPNRPRIERFWQRDLPVRLRTAWAGLAVASGVYRVGVAVRDLYWRRKKLRTPVLTVSVGNLTVGGTGKTPFTLFLANRLQRHGLRVGIVSRGYGRTRSRVRTELVADGGKLTISAEEAGDEPTMMARSFTGPIAVAHRRVNGIERLLRLGPLDAVILDDAFQHLRLSRDVDLLLVSNERGFGNGWMLPAGPMREPLGAVARANAIVLMSDSTGTSAIGASQMSKLATRQILHASVRPRALIAALNGAWHEVPLGLSARRVLAVSGLADSSGFYAMLRELDADLVGVLDYPDHHAYTHADWQTIVNAMRDADAVVVTTEKDLVKLEQFPFPRDTLYALKLEVTMDPADARALDQLTLGRLNATAPAADA
jgi:tetraacyldisaccharide 4'-kinase